MNQLFGSFGIVRQNPLCPFIAGCISTASQMVNAASRTQAIKQITAVVENRLAGQRCQHPRPGGAADLVADDLQNFIFARPAQYFVYKAVAAQAVDPACAQDQIGIPGLLNVRLSQQLAAAIYI